jgi:hypothetical protein
MRLYSPGARVSQAQYGDGTVTSADEYHTRIEFDEHGPRTFSSVRVSLTPSTTLAPVKVTKSRKRTPKVAVAAAKAISA